MTAEPEAQELLFFNGINGDRGRYDVPPMTSEELVGFIRGESPPENLRELDYRYRRTRNALFAVKEDADPTLLHESGWGVIFASDADPAIRDALGELLTLRQEQAGDYFRLFEGPEGHQPGESKNEFLARHGAGPGPVDPERVPYYLMIVGDPKRIPYRFQSQLDVQYAAGRIHFATLDDYANYARSVVKAEALQATLPHSAAFFGVANPDDASTQSSANNLVKPLFERISQATPDGTTKLFLGSGADQSGEATKAQLARLLGGDKTPSLLFLASHGMRFDLDSDRLLPHQGALLCQDWPGPRDWLGPVGQEFYFAGDDLDFYADLKGMIAFFFACNGAGTPKHDDFARIELGRRRQVAPYAFLSQLPMNMLSHPRGGALAVIGHVDRAWGHSYTWRGAGPQIEVFNSTLRSLLGGNPEPGKPVGLAVEYMNERYAELAVHLTDELRDINFGKYVDAGELASLWTAANDARGYAVIGDPAVRLPAVEADHTTGGEPVIEVRPLPPSPPETEAETDEPDESGDASSPDRGDFDFSLPTEGEREIDPYPESPGDTAQTAGPDGEDDAPQDEPRVINTGFALADYYPSLPLTPFQPLYTGTNYYFWFEEDVLDVVSSIETTPVSRPEAPVKARLTVALFDFPDGLQVQPGADIGEMEVQEDGRLVVIRQPLETLPDFPKQDIRLYFPVRVPDAPGEYRLRCNIYRGQLLLQSRLITVQATAARAALPLPERQLRSDLDYTLSNELRADLINQLEPHRMSMMLNSNGDGTHSLQIFGRTGEKVVKEGHVRFGESSLSTNIHAARSELRRASWDSIEEWTELSEYRYADGKLEWNRLQRDLVSLAIEGFNFYSELIGKLDPDWTENFRDLLAEQGTIQIAFKRSVKHLLPAALLYDNRPFNADNDIDQYSLCPTFKQSVETIAYSPDAPERAIEAVDQLLETPCWQNACPSRGGRMIVCPSGFWGYRHNIGMPLSICDLDESEQQDPEKKCSASDMPADITFGDQFRFGAAIAADLRRWKTHNERLAGLWPDLQWVIADDSPSLYHLLEDPPYPHIFYFYCHGGMDRYGRPRLYFGPESGRIRIGSSYIESESIRWQNPRPLVFMNGCHTAAVSPEQALDLITPLIRQANSAGVIGTEVTIFEQLATQFAEAFMRRFFSGVAAGKALRDARLELLLSGNPLGLVYIPFVQAGLRIVNE